MKTAPEPDPGFTWESDYLYYSVREPYPSKTTGSTMVFGRIDRSSPLTVVSRMPENGVIFSDGMEQDRMEFNSGATVKVGICEKAGNLVV